MKTRQDVEYLKQNWHSDPCWDIETTDGFSEYRNELLNYRIDEEIVWERTDKKKLWLKAHKMGLGDNIILAEYILKLEQRLESLEEKEMHKEGY